MYCRGITDVMSAIVLVLLPWDTSFIYCPNALVVICRYFVAAGSS